MAFSMAPTVGTVWPTKEKSGRHCTGSTLLPPASTHPTGAPVFKGVPFDESNFFLHNISIDGVWLDASDTLVRVSAKGIYKDGPQNWMHAPFCGVYLCLKCVLITHGHLL